MTEIQSIFSKEELDAISEIANKKLYKDNEGNRPLDFLVRLADGLVTVYPGSSIIDISNMPKKNDWKITSLNTNDDPNDNEEFSWRVRYDGFVFRNLTVREEYLKSCREAKEREDIIEHYCYRIRGVIPYYELTFEEKQRLNSRAKSATVDSNSIRITEEKQEDNQWSETAKILYFQKKPEGMTDKEWQAERREARKLRRELMKERDADMRLWQHNATGVLGHRVDRLRFMCNCTGKDIRNGRICKVCKLTKKVDNYMLDLFKSAAEGRSSNNIF
jgi:hypothetical protein